MHSSVAVWRAVAWEMQVLSSPQSPALNSEGKFLSKETLYENRVFPCSSRAGKVKCPMNFTQKETPSNSQGIIKKNDLARAAKLVTREERRELRHGGDLSAAAAARSRGKGPSMALRLDVWLPSSVGVCRKPRHARVLLFPQQGPAGNTNTQPRKPWPRDGAGRACPAPGTDRRRARNAQKQL